MKDDARQRAEQFIDQVIAPLREATERGRERPSLAEDRAQIRGALEASPFDIAKLDALAAERSKIRAARAEEERRRALSEAADIGRRLAEIGPFLFPADPSDTVIEEVTFIRSFAGQGAVLDSNIAPRDNWARYRLTSDSNLWDGTGRLSFFTLWQNPLDANAFVAPQPHVTVNAHLAADAAWSGVAAWFDLNNEARATCSLRTTIWGMNVSQQSVVDETELGSVSASSGFLGDDASLTLAFNDILPASGVIVGPKQYILIEVELVTDWHADGDASVTLDAESGARLVSLSRIVIPGVAAPVPQPGQITLTVTSVPGQFGGDVTLTWTGANGVTVDIYRNGAKVAETANDGSWSELVAFGTYSYRVCDAGTARCSIDVSVTVAGG